MRDLRKGLPGLSEGLLDLLLLVLGLLRLGLLRLDLLLLLNLLLLSFLLLLLLLLSGLLLLDGVLRRGRGRLGFNAKLLQAFGWISKVLVDLVGAVRNDDDRESGGGSFKRAVPYERDDRLYRFANKVT